MAADENRPRIISRQEAEKLGLGFFFTGKACVRGHICERRVNGGDCVKCSRVRQGLAEDIAPRTLARKAAQRLAAATYEGRPCVRGHGNLRYTSNGDCVACSLAKSTAKAKAQSEARRVERAKDPIKAAWDALTPAEKRRQLMKRWKEANAEHVADYDYEYKKRKFQEDINFKLSVALRTRLNQALKRNSKAGSAVRDLGCTIDEFREHIASQFQPGMTWENWGVGAGKWHLDHIKPLAELDMRLREDFLIGAHWSNYRPLWSEENSGRRMNLGRGKFGKSRTPEGATA